MVGFIRRYRRSGRMADGADELSRYYGCAPSGSSARKPRARSPEDPQGTQRAIVDPPPPTAFGPRQ